MLQRDFVIFLPSKKRLPSVIKQSMQPRISEYFSRKVFFVSVIRCKTEVYEQIVYDSVTCVDTCFQHNVLCVFVVETDLEVCEYGIEFTVGDKCRMSIISVAVPHNKTAVIDIRYAVERVEAHAEMVAVAEVVPV